MTPKSSMNLSGFAVDSRVHKAGPRCVNTRAHGTEGKTSMQRKRTRPPVDLRGADRELWISRHGSAWERCLQDVLSSRPWGIARHSMHNPNPPMHIVVQQGDEWRTWCGYGLADEGHRNVTGRRCSRCMTLAREEADEACGDYEVDDA